MRARAPILTSTLVFTFVHLTASIACAVAPFVDGAASALNGWAFRVIGWAMTVLALPILLPLHSETMSRGATAALIVANSVAAGSVFGLVLLAMRGHGGATAAVGARVDGGTR